MRHAIIVLTALLSLSACEKPEPKISDAKLAKIKADLPGILDSCLAKIKYEGFDAFPQKVEDCFEMTPAQRWKGVWLRAFEGMHFCPAPARTCGNAAGPSIWLDLPEVKGEAWPPRRYEIEFIGRRTQYPGMFGHMGMSDHEMVVDKLISLKPVSPNVPGVSKLRGGQPHY